jgi:hypothetical protein
VTRSAAVRSSPDTAQPPARLQLRPTEFLLQVPQPTPPPFLCGPLLIPDAFPCSAQATRRRKEVWETRLTFLSWDRPDEPVFDLGGGRGCNINSKVRVI